MSARRISFASGIVPECGPLETIRAAATGGFDAVGLWIEPPKWDAGTKREAKAALGGSGLDLLDVEVVWLKPGAADPDHFRCIDIGAELGAENLLVVSSDPDMGANAAKLNALCAHARGSGMRVSLEFGIFTEVKTIHQALGIVAAADDPQAALLIDPIHLARSGGSVADVAAVPPALLPYAQFCDAPLPGPDVKDFDAVIADALDARMQTGEGDLPLGALLKALPANIPLSIELRSKRLRERWPDPGERAKVTAQATRAWLAAQGE